MKLYSNAFSPNCRKVHAVADALGISLEKQTIDLRAGDQKKPEFLRMNPNGKVPVLVDGSTTLWESDAILCYLAGKQDTPLWPKSEVRYDILRWMFWESNHISKAIGTVFGQKVFHAQNPNLELIAKGTKEFAAHANVLNNSLESKAYLCGDAITLADYAVAVWLGYEQAFDLPLNEYKNVQRWKSAVWGAPGGSALNSP